MRYRSVLTMFAPVLFSLAAAAKDPKKTLLPTDILQAQSVLVVVDPNSGTDVHNPNANRTAQEDVEKALMKWGRFSLATEAQNADLIITVRKGGGKPVQETIGGIPSNNRHVILEPTDSGGRIGARQGTSGTASDPSDPQSPSTRPHPHLEVGQQQDTFVVYRCSSKDNPRSDPLEAPAVWRFAAKDALKSPGVPAVDRFHEIIDESEKQLAQKP